MALLKRNCFFWESIEILITKPNVVNKKIWGCTKLFQYHCKPLDEKWEYALQHFRISNPGSIENIIQDLVDSVPIELVEKEDSGIKIIVTELFPRTYSKMHPYQLVCLCNNKNVVTFYDVTPEEYNQSLCPKFSYSFCLQDDKICLITECGVSKSTQWLENTVLPQVVKWSQQESDYDDTKVICKNSLTLVSKRAYYEKYNNLKLKYGRQLVEIWPESTDPLKFVYEDVAIATYLLLLWETDVNSNQPLNFVDIGCGNGLLVYILAMEGHKGYGVDVRKRKIWDMYPNIIRLQEHTVVPSDINIFSDADWIIGNHSDELTPWIPVIAAKTSYKCKFFLLPCCTYNFDGSKYQRKKSLSQYNDYLHYVHQICRKCGFITPMDRLKIPSTKRICFVGNSRTYSEENHEKYLNCIQEMVNKELGITNTTGKEVDVKTRSPVEMVRNCTQLDKDIVRSIINCITDYLLKDIDKNSVWSFGKTDKISTLSTLLSKNMLQTLKSECGGLQTLLRNNHQIFQIQNGNVHLRYPKTIDEVKSKMSGNKKPNTVKMQVKTCWFFNNHPQGCPLQTATCSYLHEKEQCLN